MKLLKMLKFSLTSSLKNFKKHEKDIGEGLGKAAIETRDKESFIGKCMKCKEGDLQILVEESLVCLLHVLNILIARQLLLT